MIIITDKELTKLTDRIVGSKPFGVTFRVKDGCFECKLPTSELFVNLGSLKTHIKSLTLHKQCLAVQYRTKCSTHNIDTIYVDGTNIYS